MIEVIAWALRVNRVGREAAERSRTQNSAGWKDALSDARAVAILLRDRDASEAEDAKRLSPKGGSAGRSEAEASPK